ncbi:hypothetical protein BKA70DRAFT_350373 [Coprinopsis sp. MPI-PUGE-AT-0042]|nr:hypothetical protein BKA70DRAFT_350373 [Coprinopsis sp. MPI-PUGE-AT-0042]
MLRPSGLALPCIPIRLLQVLLLMGATAISESASLWVNSCRRILFVAGISARCPTTGKQSLFDGHDPSLVWLPECFPKGLQYPLDTCTGVSRQWRLMGIRLRSGFCQKELTEVDIDLSTFSPNELRFDFGHAF